MSLQDGEHALSTLLNNLNLRNVILLLIVGYTSFLYIRSSIAYHVRMDDQQRFDGY
jgi:hypothetical protein